MAEVTPHPGHSEAGGGCPCHLCLTCPSDGAKVELRPGSRDRGQVGWDICELHTFTTLLGKTVFNFMKKNGNNADNFLKFSYLTK